MFPDQNPEPLTELGLNKPAETPAPAVVPAAESLQFRTAEIPGSAHHVCSACRNGFEGEYYHMAGLVACPACAQERLAERARKVRWPEFGRAALFGLGAAAAGAALYAIISAVTGYSFSLIAIVVGVMVAKAVLYGSRGIRGRRLQVLAVLLTYGSITSSAIPEIVTQINEMVKKEEAEKKNGGAQAAAPKGPPTAANLAIAILFLIGFALVVPVLGIASIGGLINAIILAIGLREAWRRTAADDVAIAGPYQPEAAAAAGA